MSSHWGRVSIPPGTLHQGWACYHPDFFAYPPPHLLLFFLLFSPFFLSFFFLLFFSLKKKSQKITLTRRLNIKIKRQSMYHFAPPPPPPPPLPASPSKPINRNSTGEHHRSLLDAEVYAEWARRANTTGGRGGFTDTEHTTQNSPLRLDIQ